MTDLERAIARKVRFPPSGVYLPAGYRKPIGRHGRRRARRHSDRGDLMRFVHAIGAHRQVRLVVRLLKDRMKKG